METNTSTALSPVQVQVVAALAQGRTKTSAAAEAGIHRNTIHNWFHDPAFQAAVEQAQNEYAETLRDLMRDLAARALQTLREILDDPKASPSVRLKAALAILQRPHFPNPGWHLPERIETPEEQQIVNNIAENASRQPRHPNCPQRPLPLRLRPEVQALLRHQEPRQVKSAQFCTRSRSMTL